MSNNSNPTLLFSLNANRIILTDKKRRSGNNYTMCPQGFAKLNLALFFFGLVTVPLMRLFNNNYHCIFKDENGERCPGYVLEYWRRSSGCDQDDSLRSFGVLGW